MENRTRDIERALATAGASGGETPVLPIRSGESLAPYTTFGIGGPARFLVEVMSEAALCGVLAVARGCGLPWWVLGRGSNVLISDQGLPGVVIRLGGGLSRLTVSDAVLSCGGGTRLDEIAEAAETAGLCGADFLAGIPGTVGGGLRSNAGAFGHSLADIVKEVRVVDSDGRSRALAIGEPGREYRTSLVPEGVVVTEVKIRLEPGRPTPAGEIRRRRWEKQPSEPSAGSFFKNPEQEPAGRLIDRCGLKGRRVGAACVSPKHANFIVNTGGALFADVYGLAQIVKADVEEQTGILLEEEVRVLSGGEDGQVHSKRGD